MRNLKRVFSLLVVLSMAVCMTCFAAAGDPGTIKNIEVVDTAKTSVAYENGDVNFALTYSGAQAGGMYLVLVLSDEDVPTASNILYVNQETAEGTSVSFDNVYPTKIQDSFIYLAGTGMEYTKLGKINANVEESTGTKGDVNEDGVVDIVDLQRLFAHLNGSNLLVNLLAGDVNGDGAVDIVDLQRLFAHLNGSNLLN